MDNKFFAGFIITYNRPDILKDTIEQVFAQTFPPEKIWIIDNSEGSETTDLIQTIDHYPLAYLKMGYNAGPAGAAAKGLQLVASEGYDWIYWGDDDDPPFSSDCFEKLLKIETIYNAGIIGSVGQYFNSKSGTIKRTPNENLIGKEFLEVDSIAGNMSMIVNSKVIKEGIKPNQSLFFGFEELDFCLKAKKGGFKVMVNTSLFLEARRQSGRLNFQQPLYIKKNNINREYYSLRNLLMISDDFGFKKMKFLLHIKWFLKSFYGFRYGWLYGKKNFHIIWLAFFHYWRGIKGKTIDL